MNDAIMITSNVYVGLDFLCLNSILELVFEIIPFSSNRSFRIRIRSKARRICMNLFKLELFLCVKLDNSNSLQVHNNFKMCD